MPGLEHLGREPLMSVTRGQCDARPTVTFPAARHHRPLVGTKLYCLVTEAHVLTTCPGFHSKVKADDEKLNQSIFTDLQGSYWRLKLEHVKQENKQNLQWHRCWPQCSVVAENLLRNISTGCVEQFCHAGHKQRQYYSLLQRHSQSRWRSRVEIVHINHNVRE